MYLLADYYPGLSILHPFINNFQCFAEDQLAPIINEILLRMDKVEKQLCSDDKRTIGFR